MREQLESLVLVLAVGAAVAIAAKRAGAPYNVALVVVGLLLVFADVLPHTPLDPEIVLVAFLPVLVFEGALFADVDALLRESRPILTLALPGVAVSLLGTAVVATFALRLPFAAALLLGALLAITDTVSVLLAFRSVRVPGRLAAIMEGESLFNDGTALVLVSLTAGVLATGKLDAATTIRSLLAAIGGGLAVGAAFGAIGAMVLRRTPDHLTAILASSVLVFATALLAERMHASPVIAVVVVGLVIGRAARKILEPSRVLALQGFWEVAGFVINVVLFLLVGMQIEARSIMNEAGAIALALVALHIGRALAVYGSFGIVPKARAAVPLRWRHVMVFGNIKGALSMAAVLALPAGLAYRDRLITIVFGVTVVTLLTQALPFGRILRMLRVTIGSDVGEHRAKATLIAARRGQVELEDLLATGLVSRKDHAERRAELQRQVIEAEAVLRARPDEPGLDPHVEVSLLTAQKAALSDAARRGLVDNDAAEHLIAQLDRQLLAATHHELDEE